MPPKKNSTPTKNTGTVPKRKKEGASPFSQKKKKNVPTLTVHSFAKPLEFEAYIYEQKEGSDGYLKGVEDVLGGVTTCDYFMDAFFIVLSTAEFPNLPAMRS